MQGSSLTRHTRIFSVLVGIVVCAIIILYYFHPVNAVNRLNLLHVSLLLVPSNRSTVGQANVSLDNPAQHPVTVHSNQTPLPATISLAHPAKREQLWADPKSKENMLIRRVGYIDDRFDKPFIVLIAMRNEKIKRQDYYAKVMYKTTFLCLPLNYWIKSGHLDLRHYMPEIYVHYLLKTNEAIRNETPLGVHVTPDKSCNSKLSALVRIEWPKRDTEKRVKYGVCLHKALFKIKDPQLLVDWIEVHKALGVESFTVYIEDVPEAIASAVQIYVKQGLLELLDWKMDKVTRDYGQSGVMNDCLYRNLYRTEFLGTYDLDEVVVPQKLFSWDEMFQELSKVKNFEKAASFVFRGLRWHDGKNNMRIGRTEKLCNSSRLPLFFTKTIREKNAGDHPKVIIRPQLTTNVQVHDIRGWISEKGAVRAIHVPQQLATCHHYREPDSPGRTTNYSDMMSRYKTQVLTGIRRTVCSE